MTAPTPEFGDLLRRLRIRALGDSEQKTRDEAREAADALAAVTAERDQALEALAATNKLGAFETGKTIGAAEVRKELDQARQMLAGAPHAESCMTEAAGVYARLQGLLAECDCWKAGL